MTSRRASRSVRRPPDVRLPSIGLFVASARRFARAGFAGLATGLVLAGCPKPKPDPAQSDAGAAAPSGSVAVTTQEKPADGVHGKQLVADFQCNRCHDGTGHPAAAQNKHCVHCHKDIMEDRFQASAASIARWKPRVKELADAPSLEATGKRLSRTWVENYLLTPKDLRPHLHQYMPRLPLTRPQARDIAAYLVPDADTVAVKDPPETKGADVAKGRQLLESKGCTSCHTMTGVSPLTVAKPPQMDPKDFDRGHKLAPDLRFTRERMTPTRLVAWMKDPKGIKPDTPMPRVELSDTDVRDLAGYLLQAELAPAAAPPKPQRLPVLTRKVTFKEVDEKVFHRTCWHCHSEPDYAIGDGGPGNSGGFGFKPRGLNLADYNAMRGGYLDDKNERASIFVKEADGLPRIMRALMARYDEEAGADTGPVRGMPLGYEPLALEDIQLVETWIEQGLPR